MKDDEKTPIEEFYKEREKEFIEKMKNLIKEIFFIGYNQGSDDGLRKGFEQGKDWAYDFYKINKKEE